MTPAKTEPRSGPITRGGTAENGKSPWLLSAGGACFKTTAPFCYPALLPTIQATEKERKTPSRKYN